MQGHCPRCNKIVEGVHPVGGKIAAAVLSSALGAGTTKNVGGAVVGALIGAYVGHIIDTQVKPRCPECAALLRIVAATI